jgi:hypothetical protein
MIEETATCKKSQEQNQEKVSGNFVKSIFQVRFFKVYIKLRQFKIKRKYYIKRMFPGRKSFKSPHCVFKV